MIEKESIGKKLQDELLIKNKNATFVLSYEELKEIDEYCEVYKDFLNKSKTERNAVKYSIELLKKNGFTEYNYKEKYFPGDKVYLNNRNKSIICAVIGKNPIEDGVKIIASHIDCPRIDLKPRPLYEESQLAFFKTHYYGGIKKYQWVTIPLSLIGVIIKSDGTTIDVCIGEDENDPVFCINDLLPHLAKDQMQKKMSEGIKGEELNIIVGSRCYRDEEIAEKVKLNIIKYLNEKYSIVEYDFLSAELTAVPNFKARDIGFDRSLIGSYGQDDRVSAYTSLTAFIVEYDFLSAELTAVPNFKARDIGFDRSLIGSYGQDDRVSAYTSLTALIDAGAPNTTSICILADKEEIGSEGNTGLKCAFLRYFIADLAKHYNVEARTVLSNSECLSADVNAGFDPAFSDVAEKRNTAYMNYGVVVTKYVGARGKSGTSDANAEFVAKIRRILDKNNIIWQTGELGKVDQGGGGTVAAYIANLNVDVVDIGVPILSMHSPFELSSKTDVYMAYKSFLAFYKD